MLDVQRLGKQGGGQAHLADAGWTQEQDIGGGLQKALAGQLAHESLGHARMEAEVECLQSLVRQ
jgi:hypothetical protein